MRGDLFCLGFDLLQRIHQRHTTDGSRARTIGTHPKRHLAGITVDDINVVNVHAERLND